MIFRFRLINISIVKMGTVTIPLVAADRSRSQQKDAEKEDHARDATVR